MRAFVRPSRLGDVRYLENRLRTADMVELEALDVTPWDSLKFALDHGECLTVVIKGKPVAMFGVVTIVPTQGVVWLLGSDELLTVSKQFLRESKEWLSYIGHNCNVLFNRVHFSNTVHIRWLKWLGFSFGPQVGDFIPFSRST